MQALFVRCDEGVCRKVPEGRNVYSPRPLFRIWSPFTGEMKNMSLLTELGMIFNLRCYKHFAATRLFQQTRLGKVKLGEPHRAKYVGNRSDDTLRCGRRPGDPIRFRSLSLMSDKLRLVNNCDEINFVEDTRQAEVCRTFS